MRRKLGLVFGLLVVVAPRPAGATLDLPALCDDDRDCAPYPENPWCDPNGSCYRCSENTDCTALDEVCEAGACVLPCVDAMDCTAAEATCHPDEGHCVECIDETGCLDAEYCSVGLCVPDGCRQGETQCAEADSMVVACNAAGGGWDPVEECVAGACTMVDGAAMCVAGGSSSGGSTSADGSTGGVTTGVDTTTGGGTTVAAADDGSGSSGEPEGTGGDASDEGCGCRATPDAFSLAWLLLLLLSRRRTRH